MCLRKQSESSLGIVTRTDDNVIFAYKPVCQGRQPADADQTLFQTPMQQRQRQTMDRPATLSHLSRVPSTQLGYSAQRLQLPQTMRHPSRQLTPESQILHGASPSRAQGCEHVQLSYRAQSAPSSASRAPRTAPRWQMSRRAGSTGRFRGGRRAPPVVPQLI